MDLPAEAKSNIAGYRAFPFATLRVAMFGVPPFGFITPFAPLIPQRPPLAVAPTSANAFHYISLCKLSIASSSSFIVFEWSFFLLLDFPVTKNSTDVFKASAIVTACSAFGSLSLLIHDCNVELLKLEYDASSITKHMVHHYLIMSLKKQLTYKQFYLYFSLVKFNKSV